MPQSFSAVYVHLVFSTKNRVPFLKDTEIQHRTFAYLARLSKNMDSQALIVGGQSDHIHVLACQSRTLSQAEWVKELKRLSSLWVEKQGAAYKDFAWQSGYGNFSVSYSNLDKVKNYILNQEEHHKKRTFQDEYRSLLEKHKVEYDERYVWD